MKLKELRNDYLRGKKEGFELGKRAGQREAVTSCKLAMYLVSAGTGFVGFVIGWIAAH